MTGPNDTLYMALTHELPGFLSKSLLQCKRLPALPSVALRVLDIARSPKATLSDYAKAIENDPALTLRLIALANSAYYARSTARAQTCLDAMQRLGLNATLAVILGFTLFTHAQGHDYHCRMWQRSITSALIARYLAEQLCPESSGTAFTLALLQDIGILALQAAYPEEADTLYADAALSHGDIAQGELAHFGCDHTLVGAWLAAKWGMPDATVMAIRQSHDSFLVKDKVLLCMRVSGPIADAWLSRSAASKLAAVLYQLKSVSHTSALELDDVLHHVQQQSDILANALRMTAPVDIDSTTLLSEAHQLLFQHTLALGTQLDDQQQALVSLRSPDADRQTHSLRDASRAIRRSGLTRNTGKT
ncbi:HDOD domain-containing protein [Halomonas aquamarina]|uniref:HDOD domain-containing protein n=1 Tax=Vreelandella aquamarina TaxID=77097 RepID=A0ACC5VY06_9GAMM|nr:HDOD domain-containing protein [Halomonas aquamarina]MBZ5488394.1 HDOD domain-containing protein [Halomonas aquamarina]